MSLRDFFWVPIKNKLLRNPFFPLFFGYLVGTPTASSYAILPAATATTTAEYVPSSGKTCVRIIQSWEFRYESNSDASPSSISFAHSFLIDMKISFFVGVLAAVGVYEGKRWRRARNERCV